MKLQHVFFCIFANHALLAGADRSSYGAYKSGMLAESAINVQYANANNMKMLINNQILAALCHKHPFSTEWTSRLIRTIY